MTRPPVSKNTPWRGQRGRLWRTTAASGSSSRWPGLTTPQSLAVASQFGVSLVVAVGLGLLAGRWLDDMLRTGIALTVVGALLGLAAGIVSTVGQYRATLRRSAGEWQSEQTTAAERAALSQRRDT